MFVAVRMLYREGIGIKPGVPVVGQIISESERGVRVLQLWPVDWVHNATWPTPPLAVLWHPVLCGVGFDDIVFRGLEAVPRGQARRWSAQKWLCDVLDGPRARDYLKPHMVRGALPSQVPPSPPPADMDHPFASAAAEE